MRAFEDSVIVQSCPVKIDRVHFRNGHDRLFLIGQQNNLLIYQRLDDLWVPVQQLKGFARKSIDQLEIITELDMIFALVDGVVCLYDLETLALRSSLARTKGASCFLVSRVIENVSTTRTQSAGLPPASLSASQSQTSLDQPSPADSPGLPAAQVSASEDPGIPAMVTRLIVAVKRKLIVFRWADTDYLDSSEYALSSSDRVRSMEMLGKYELCLALSKDYCIYDLQARLMRTLFPISGLPFGTDSAALASRGPGDLLSVASFKPLITSISNGNEVLVLKQNVGVFLGAGGVPTRNYAISWSRIPDYIAYSFPYLIALFTSNAPTQSLLKPFSTSSDTSSSTGEQFKAMIEIRNVSTASLIQQIELDKAAFLCSSFDGKGPVYVAAESMLWQLSPVSAGQQVDELVDTDKYDDAIDLLDQMDSLPSDEKGEKLMKVKTLKVVHLFYGKQNYQAAFKLLDELEYSITDVICSLYPMLLTDSIKKILFPKDPHASVGKQKATFTTSLDTSSIADASKRTEGNATFKTGLKSAPSYQSITQSLLHSIANSYPQSQKNSEKQSIEQFIPYLTQTRTNHTAKLVDAQNKSDSELVRSIEFELQLIDTTLLKSYLETNESLIGPLLRLPNRVNIFDAEEYLMKAKKWIDLVELYRGKNMHRQALSLLSKQVKSTGQPLAGSLHMSIYLQKLGRQFLDLIFEFSTPLLQTFPDDGLEVFTDDDPSNGMLVHELPRDAVLSHLDKIDVKLAMKYLEHIIHTRKDETPDFHNRLAAFYLDRILQALEKERDRRTNIMVQIFSKESHIQEYRSDLMSFLENSRFYKAELLLSKFPPDVLYEERAILMYRLGQHERALSIYIYDLQNWDLAERYCNRLYDETGDASAYQHTVRIYLSFILERGVPQTFEDFVFRLLSAYGDRISAMAVLSLLGKDTPVVYLHGYFVRNLENIYKSKNQMALAKNVTSSRNQQLKIHHQGIENQSVTIREGTLCAICKKRMGANTAFGITRKGEGKLQAVHFACNNKII